jgi:hypothetical protein
MDFFKELRARNMLSRETQLSLPTEFSGTIQLHRSITHTHVVKKSSTTYVRTPSIKGREERVEGTHNFHGDDLVGVDVRGCNWRDSSKQR